MSDKNTPADEDDLDKLDDGSIIDDASESEDGGGDKGDKGEETRARGTDGRFVASKKDDEADGGEDKEDEEDEEDEGDEEDEEPEGGEDDDKARTQGRIRTLVEQRNKAREEAAALSARVSDLEKKNNAAAREEEDTTKALREELEGLYEQVEELRADSRTKEAAKAQRRIDEIRGELSDIKQATKVRQEAFMVAENREYDRMLDILEAVRPVVNKDSEDFDPDVVRELDFQVRAYTGAGMTPTKALRRACALIFTEDPFAPASRATKPEKDDRKDKVDKKPFKKTTDVKKNLEAAKKQPAKVERSESGRETKIRVADLSDEEFAALPASKLAELGGDFL